MRVVEAVGFGPPDVLRDGERPDPEPGPGEVAIAVRYAGVNFADVMTRRGEYHRAGLPPLVPGIEVSGTVIAAGAGVRTPAVGTRVAAFTGGGGYADISVARASLSHVLPASVSDTVAAAMPTVAPTAMFLIDEVARLRVNESVLVHAAAGGVGTMVGQLARIRGADLVLGTVGSSAKIEYASRFGYDGVFERDDFVEHVQEATGGRGVDVVLDSVGGGARADSLATLAPLGRLVAFGNASGQPEQSTDGAMLRTQNKAYLGFSLGSLSAAEPARVRSVARAALELVAAGRLRPDITEIHPLAEAARAHERLEAGRTVGKLLLAIDPAT